MNVSRETSLKLEQYAELVRKWSPKINLVAKSTLDTLEVRHISDSLETISLAPNNIETWLDLGSGGGFPGLIAAVYYHDRQWQPRFTLVESDARKSAFLRTVARELDLDVEIKTERIEAIPAMPSNVISARALAPLQKLLEYCLPHIAPETLLILPKGSRWKDEVMAARAHFRFSLDVHPSLTQEGSVNLLIKDLSRA